MSKNLKQPRASFEALQEELTASAHQNLLWRRRLGRVVQDLVTPPFFKPQGCLSVEGPGAARTHYEAYGPPPEETDRVFIGTFVSL